MKNIIESWKTTLIGIILLISGVLYTLGSVYFKSDVNYVVMIILLGSGIAMMFSPDTLIEKLNDLITKKSKEV